MNTYNEIEVHKTEYIDKYLLISMNKTLYVGFIVKDVLNFLKSGFNTDVITSKINKKHDIQLSYETINDIRTSIDEFLINEEKSNLYRIIKLFNPNKISIPEVVINIFLKKYFYLLFSFFLTLNGLIYSLTSNYNHTNPSNQILILISIFLVLIFHELGHSIAAKGFNLDVNEIGFGLYYIFPVFYVDLNQSWKLKKEKRTIINLSGIYIQLIIGIILIILSYFLNDNRVILTVFKINFYIILFNLNPFLKFDGYWVLSDWLGENNLMKKSNTQIKEKFKVKPSEKTKVWINVYTISRILFIAYLFYVLFTKIISITNKIFSNMSLTLSENIFILIVAFIMIKSIITKIRKNGFTTRKG